MLDLFWYDTEKMSIIISYKAYGVLGILLTIIIAAILIKYSKISNDIIVGTSSILIIIFFLYSFANFK